MPLCQGDLRAADEGLYTQQLSQAGHKVAASTQCPVSALTQLRDHGTAGPCFLCSRSHG